MKFAAFDLETSGRLPEYALQPWRLARGDAWLTSFVGARRVSRDDVRLYDATLGQDMKTAAADFLQACIDNDEYIATWYGQFDIAWLIALGLNDLVLKAKWIDGMLLWRHATVEPEYDTDRAKKKSYGLKEAVAHTWPEHAGYEEDVDFHATDPESITKLHGYNIRDTIFTLRLTKRWWDALNERQQRAALIEADSLPLVARANLEGMVVDVLSTRELEQHLTDVAEAKLEVLAEHGVTEKVVRSPTQLASLMYDTWGLPVLKENTGKKTGNISRSTDKEVLHELSFLDPRAKELRAYREALNNRTKFATGILTSCAYNEDGRVHPQANVFGTYTSRLTYSSKQGKNKDERPIGFALHQEKRDPMFRGAIMAPPGHTIVEFDASGQEYRWMAIASGDEAMLTLCQPGEDPHAYMGSQIAAVDYRFLQAAAKIKDTPEAEMRQMGKVGNLSCIAAGTTILTDSGEKPIEAVTPHDLVWDGLAFVSHAGVVYMGTKQVITYAGLTATPDHLVLVGDAWVEFQTAAARGWRVAHGGRPDLRPVDRADGRDSDATQRALCAGSMCVRHGETCQPTNDGGWAVSAVQDVPVAAGASCPRQVHTRNSGGSTLTEARECYAAALHQSARWVLAQLRRARDRISVRLRGCGGAVDQRAPTSPDVSAAGRRQDRQQRALRARELTASYAAAEPSQPRAVAVYDILNCGPRNRFVANGLIVHNCQYRVSARKLLVVARVQYDMGINFDQAAHIWSTYRSVYHGVKTYWGNQASLARRQGYVETFAGRRVQLPAWSSNEAWKIESTAINYPIQGTGGEQKYLALSVLKGYITQIDAKFAWDLHDGLYFYVPDHHVERAAVEMKHILDNLPYKRAWGFTPPIPLPWDCKVGKSWGALREWKYT